MKQIRQSGITLIALVITIIVILILAGVTINTMFANESVLKKTEGLSAKNALSQAKESVNLEAINSRQKYYDTIYDGSQSDKELDEYIKTSFKDGSFTLGVENVEIAWAGQYIKLTYFDGTIVEGMLSNGNITWEDIQNKKDGTFEQWDGNEATEPTEKTENEIHIYTCNELKWLADQVNSGINFKGYTIYLENSLDFGARPVEIDETDTKYTSISDEITRQVTIEEDKWIQNESKKWTPIGKTSSLKFEGTFDGKNNTVKGIYVNSTDDRMGLFGSIAGTIKRLTIKDSYIKGATRSGGIVGLLSPGEVINCHNVNTVVSGTGLAFGGIVGYEDLNCTVAGCTNSGKIIVTNYCIGGVVGFCNSDSVITDCKNSEIVMGTMYVGGITGYAQHNCIQEDCSNTGNIYSTGKYAGGIIGVGTNYFSIARCSNDGNITGKSDRVGGITGAVNINGKITKCINNGEINGDGSRVGGLSGSANTDTTFMECINNGDVNGNRLVGGIVGSGGKTIKECANTGDIKGNKDKVAGIVGDGNTEQQQLTLCYNSGNVEGNGDYVAGIVGWLCGSGAKPSVTQCYNKGIVTNNNASEKTGSLIGFLPKDGEVSKCYYLNTITTPSIGQLEAGGSSTIEAERAKIEGTTDMTYEQFKAFLNT